MLRLLPMIHIDLQCHMNIVERVHRDPKIFQKKKKRKFSTTSGQLVNQQSVSQQSAVRAVNYLGVGPEGGADCSGPRSSEKPKCTRYANVESV